MAIDSIWIKHALEPKPKEMLWPNYVYQAPFYRAG